MDPKAVEIVDSIDWDFQRIAQPRRMAGCVLRGALFDVWVREFRQRHPDGTVVEIGAGLNTRFERLDNGRVHWFDLDLPDMIEPLRASLWFFGRFFPKAMSLYRLNLFVAR